MKFLTPLCLLLFFTILAQTEDNTIIVHLRGVNDSRLSLIPLSGNDALKPLIIKDGIKKGDSVIIHVPINYVPGEFVLRFDYREKESDTPYPSEKKIIINNQDLELWVHPIYCNNPDSAWFQDGERENAVHQQFMTSNESRKSMLGLLQNFLLNYDDTGSDFYQSAVEEYENRRKGYNQWIDTQIKHNISLFVSNLFRFEHVPHIEWEGSEAERKLSLRENYFEGMDFSEALITRTSVLKQWMDSYVNLYGELATTIELRDSLFTLAGKNAIEKAKAGDPQVYGWMVDYFFNGYEGMNIEDGIRMLEAYVNDPACLATKKGAIKRRLSGIETLIPGTRAPDLKIPDSRDKLFELYNYNTEKQYTLILFWSADCGHCMETVNELNNLLERKEVNGKLEVIAVSIDQTDLEIEAWNQKIRELDGWIHIRPSGDLRSQMMSDYYIIGIPVMILVDSDSKEIISLPETASQLKEFMLSNNDTDFK